MNRVVAIVQARMGSTRFPGKVLTPLAGKPILWHVVHRLRKCKMLDAIALATSTNLSDDPIAEFALREDIQVVRGPEDNVLARYKMAADQLEADIIVRVTGDAPLIDPGTIDLLIEKLIECDVDFCIGNPKVETIHEGFSPFTRRALDKLVREAWDDPAAREHVTAYFKEHPEFVPIAFVQLGAEYHFSGARLSVDTPSDLCFLETVYAELKVLPGEADVKDVARLLRSKPDLLKINTHVHQKMAKEETRRALFRCDGNSKIGLGHVYRCLALADELRERHGWGVSFAMATGTSGFDVVKNNAHTVESMPYDSDEGAWMNTIINRLHPDVLILDVRSDLARGDVAKWRDDGLLIVTIDDASERRFVSDLAFYPPVPQVRRMDWSTFSGKLYIGWEWVILRKEFSTDINRESAALHASYSEIPQILITMGGSDPEGMTLKAVSALDALDAELECIVVLGAGFARKAELDKALTDLGRRFAVIQNAQNMAELMARSDLAVTSFGVTACELAAMDVPAIYLCLTSDHAESASVFVEAGLGISLGLDDYVSERALAEAVGKMLKNMSGRFGGGEALDESRSPLVDGEGVARIAKIIAETVNA